jgi:alginate O-acetyltransferase complex protein AlgI
VIGLFIAGCREKWQSGVLLILSLCGNLGLLLVFKYGAFFLSIIGIRTTLALSLPIGISFYTFQTMSYTIDLYKGAIKPQRDPVAFLSYVSMFPQLVAGPIVRYADVEDNLTQRRVSLTGFSSGITRFAAGLAKKIILANHAGKIATRLLSAASSELTVAGVWLGAVMFMFQIYFDFSSYSDMAIGLGKMIGFDFKENFDHPYTAKSVTEFWRRWHISLSSFFRDYIYIPLGGNRKNQMFNLLVVWFITGLWHGASVNFILWGLYYCVILIIEKFALKKVLQKIPVFLARIYSLLIVLIGWLIFYYTDLSALITAGATFFGFSGRFIDHNTVGKLLANLWILPVFAVFSTRLPLTLFERLKARFPVAEPIINSILLCISFALLVGQSFNPFLYFRF